MNDVLPIHRGYQCTCGINKRNNQQLQFSISNPQTRRRGTRKSTTKKTSKRTPTYRTSDPLPASSWCPLMVFNGDHPCRCHPWIVITLGILAASPAPPGAVLDRFPAPSVSLATRYRRLVFASRDLCRRSSPSHFESLSVYLSQDPSTVQWNTAGLD